jgi:hypothetical protein
MNRSAPGRNIVSRALGILRSMLFGATVYDMVQEALKMKWQAEQMLMLVAIGDMVGIPVCSYYRLKVIPHFLPRIEAWKRALLKEKDVLEALAS